MEKDWGLLGFLVLSLCFLVSTGQNIGRVRIYYEIISKFIFYSDC